MTDRRVLFFGDSHTAGVGDPAGLGWVGRVVAASFAAGLPLTAYNLGVRRETSEQVVARWQAEAEPRLTPDARSMVVFAVGANDTTVEDGAPRVATRRSQEALGRALDDAAQLGLAAFVVGPAPVGEPDQVEAIASLSRRLAPICEQRDVPFAEVASVLRDSATWHRELAAGDGAHPGAVGYEHLAELVLDAGWLEWLRSAG